MSSLNDNNHSNKSQKSTYHILSKHGNFRLSSRYHKKSNQKKIRHEKYFFFRVKCLFAYPSLCLSVEMVKNR